MPEPTSQITIISDLLKRDPNYKEVIDQLEERLYNRYMVYLTDKPKFNDKTSVIPRPYLNQILSFKNTLELNKISKKYNLSQEQRDGISNILWKIFYREVEMKNLPQMLNSELIINNIRLAYQISVDIANLYMPISDYLGDIPMIVKKWQYEIPAEEFSIINSQSSIKPLAAIEPAQPTAQMPTAEKLPVANYQLPVAKSLTPPPIRPPIINEAQNMKHETQITKALETTMRDESIPKVQETLSRIAAASNRINDQTQKTAQEQIQQIQPPSQELPTQPIQQIPQPPTAGHVSDLEPEYLPDDLPAKPQPQPTPESAPVNKANVIDLKNF